jgi:hypothetical protein
MGDALFHLAWSEEIGGRSDRREESREAAAEPVMDEDEII